MAIEVPPAAPCPPARRGGSLRRRLLPLLGTLVLLSTAACSAAHADGGGGGSSVAGGTTVPLTSKGGGTHQGPPPKPAVLTISPADGSSGVAPAEGISVHVAAGGRIERVTVHSAGPEVTGTYAAGGGSWHSNWALGVSLRYTVTAVARRADGKIVRATSTFETVVPRQTFQTEIYEGYDLTYGVGMPIQLDFTRPIVDRAAVERSLQIFTSKPVIGAWYWDGDEQVDFRPRTYWPAGTKVTFVGHLDGVEAAPGVYGDHQLTQTFLIGSSLIVVASTVTHYMDVYLNGKHIYHWPVSTGRPGLNTPNGTYVTIDKANPQLMVGPGYSLEVPWSVRFTMSGDFLHDAYWSVGEQGFINVSHGCVNMPPADAEIYYNMAVPGDPVTITGSPVGGTWNDGFTEWFLTWDQVVAGSALHEAVIASRSGSYFVSATHLPPAHGTPPLATSAPGNSAALAA